VLPKLEKKEEVFRRGSEVLKGEALSEKEGALCQLSLREGRRSIGGGGKEGELEEGASIIFVRKKEGEGYYVISKVIGPKQRETRHLRGFRSTSPKKNVQRVFKERKKA